MKELIYNKLEAKLELLKVEIKILEAQKNKLSSNTTRISLKELHEALKNHFSLGNGQDNKLTFLLRPFTSTIRSYIYYNKNQKCLMASTGDDTGYQVYPDNHNDNFRRVEYIWLDNETYNSITI